MKRAKAQLSPELINDYFNNLELTIANVPPENILNFDLTNNADDPGRQKVFVKKGTFADGTLLPPYIVYKSNNIYPE
ncbi:hypothetical protein NQ315_005716 [Exocentrus adspersus]|uniref:Uncharacterized protein n=1 Tax=Exocentrus adspersus TaxID=1586481 RepID=A0AAV8VIB9_9CUCU|nr:hypothetical protein NQ315_005716 [Exocentrus adspersus]